MAIPCSILKLLNLAWAKINFPSVNFPSRFMLREVNGCVGFREIHQVYYSMSEHSLKLG